MADHARHKADTVALRNLTTKDNVDVVGHKPVKNDTWVMSLSEETKQNRGAEHYERPLNVEFKWDPEHLSNNTPLEGQHIKITIDMVKNAISTMKLGKATYPSGIVVEMIRAAGDTGAIVICNLAIRNWNFPTDVGQG